MIHRYNFETEYLVYIENKEKAEKPAFPILYRLLFKYKFIDTLLMNWYEII